MKKGTSQELVRLQTYVPAALAKQVEEDAQKNHRAVAGEIWYILEQYFKQKEAGKQQEM